MRTRLSNPARSAALLTAATLVTGIAIVGSTGPAHAMCDVDTVTYKTPDEGRTVWIPTNVSENWQQGGTQSRTYSEGETKSTATGRSHAVGGSVGVPIKLVTVSGKYDYTWSQTTQRTITWTQSHSFTLDLPEGKTSRSRLYHKGRKFPVKQIVNYTNNCETKVFWHTAVVPTSKNTSSHYMWAVELYANRGNLK